jgi:hypothetical protein
LSLVSPNPINRPRLATSRFSYRKRPHPCDHIHECSTPHKAKEANVIVGHPSSTGCTPHSGHARDSHPHLEPRIPCVFLKPTSIVGLSVPESVGTAITWDPDILVSGEASHNPRHSSPGAHRVQSLISDDRAPMEHLIRSRFAEEWGEGAKTCSGCWRRIGGKCSRSKYTSRLVRLLHPLHVLV